MLSYTLAEFLEILFSSSFKRIVTRFYGPETLTYKFWKPIILKRLIEPLNQNLQNLNENEHLLIEKEVLSLGHTELVRRVALHKYLMAKK